MFDERRSRTLLAATLAVLVSGDGSQAQTPPAYTNHLINEKSPYLQQHAHNPVEWFPWGPEAFEKARRENKPIFLSIGYSTCHWCHVMEAETFSDPAMAGVMNQSVVSIKVDREERPDVDRVYMGYVVASTGGGGWPLSVFLTPDLKPFFGATYLPPDDRNGKAGFRTLLQRVSAQWTMDRTKILEYAKTATELIELQAAAGSPGSRGPDARVLERTYQEIRSMYDAEEGGFGPAPKFPRPSVLNFLLRHYARSGTRAALDMTLRTLGAMAAGGIHDHLGGGFHRYATDREWRVPHFEKMLYDQAQIAVSYSEAFQVTKDGAFAVAARDTLDYVLAEMRDQEGGFHSAEDADSLDAPGAPRAAEGAFYVWTAGQLSAALGDEAAAIVSYHYGVGPAGNVPAKLDIQGELKGRNILAVRRTTAETASRFKKTEREIADLLGVARRKLQDARSARPRPPRDDKVLVAWNGMMLTALARAAQVFDEARYLEAAQASASFIERRMWDGNTNTLKRRYRLGDADIDALLEDYAFLVQGLLDLYEASFDVKWLAWAVRLQEQQDRLFWDTKNGAYFSTRADASNILVRIKDDYDGAEPSPNSVSAMNLLRLWQMTDRKAWRDMADKTFAAQASQLTGPGATVPQLAAALDYSLSKPKQIVIAGTPGAADTRAMLRLVHQRFIPNKILMVVDGGPAQAAIAKWLPFVGNMDRRDGKATAYICENYACNLPTSDLQVAARLLDGKTP